MQEIIHKYLMSKDVIVSGYLLEYYAKLSMTAEEFMFFLQVTSALASPEGHVNMSHIAKRMQLSEQAVLLLLDSLVAKNLLEMKPITNQDGKSDIAYSFDKLYQKLAHILVEIETTEHSSPQMTQRDLLDVFESEFQRQLTPLELETIQNWVVVDQYDPDVIRYALKEAVLAQVYNLKYIDRILLSWERKNIRTVQQIEQESQRYRQERDSSSNSQDPAVVIPMHDWTKK